MIRITIVLLVWLIGSSWMIYGFEWFSEHSKRQYQSIIHVCELSGQTWCVDASNNAMQTIQPILQSITMILNASSVYKKEQLLWQVNTMIPALETYAESNSSLEKKILAELLMLWLNDIIILHEQREKSIFVSSEIINWLETDILWNPILSPIRQQLIQQLITKGFDRFVTQPYDASLWVLTTTPQDRKQWNLSRNITTKDALDSYLIAFLNNENNTSEDLWIPKNEYENREWLYLFKNSSDLEALWYEVVTHRTRTNADAEYRRENIATAFEQIGNLRVLNPWQTISYLQDSNFDMQQQQLYRNGKAIFLDEEIEAYGGGLCGWSTALYQWTFLNQSLDFTKRNHSKWYTNLYTATINGEEQSLPWIDSTIYYPSLDLKVTNTATYPIIIVSNYDGSYRWVEEVFTMSPRSSDQGEYRFVQSWPRWYTLNTADGEWRAVTGRCYEWEINGALQTKCYKEVF